MFTNLPTTLKDAIYSLLATDNFPAAKKLYDQWLSDATKTSQQSNTSELHIN